MDFLGKRLTIKSTFSTFQSEEKAAMDLNDNVLLEPIYPEAYDLSYTCYYSRTPSSTVKW